MPAFIIKVAFCNYIFYFNLKTFLKIFLYDLKPNDFFYEIYIKSLDILQYMEYNKKL